MTNLQNKSHYLNSNNNDRKEHLTTCILFAFERTKTEPFNIENMIDDVLEEFPRMSDETFRAAIRNGSLGVYGRTFKLSTQEVCFWIREYIRNKNSKNVLL